MLLASLALTCAAWVGLPPRAQDTDPADVRAAVERFFATQEAEDLDGYLALWSSDAQRPAPAALKTIFDSGSDRFTDLTIVKVTTSGTRLRVRVSITRERTDTRTLAPDGTPRTFTTRFTTSLTFVREDGALKLLSEGPPAEDLAAALIAAPTAAEREVLLAAESDLITPMLIAALARRADSLAQAMKFEEAEHIYERVLEIARRLGDPKAEGQALQNLGNSQYFRRAFAAALRSYEQRLTVERQAGHDEGIAAALLGIATIRYSTFEYGAALTAYGEALALYERLEDDVGIATTLVSTGNVLYLQGDYDSAIADYRRSRALHRKTFNFGGEARALEGLGRTLAAQGDLAGALEAYSGVLQEAVARKVRPMQATATQNVGDIHFRLGNLDAARAAFEESRGHFEAVKDLEGVGRVWQALALTDLVANRFAAAEKAYRESMSACTTAGEPECVARAIVGLGFAQASQEKFDEAIAAYGKGIDAFTTLGRTVEAARGEIGLSQALFGKRDYTAALAAAARARAAGVAQQNDDVLWRADVATARAWRKLEAPGKASAAAADAIASIQRLWAAARHQPSERVPSDSTSAFAIRAVLQAESGDARAAFTTLEELRAHALRLSLATVEREIARGMTAEERASERAAAVELASLHVQLEQERRLPRPDAARIARLQERLVPAAAKRAELERALYERLPSLRTWRGLGPTASLTDIAALAAEREALASFVLDEHDLLLITLTRGDSGPDVRASVVPVKRQKVAELIAAATAPDVMGDIAKWRRAAADLVALFPADAVERLATAARVIVVPDDVLWRVPFEALPYKAGWLGDRTRFTYAGSFRDLTLPLEARDDRPLTPIVTAAAPTLATTVRDRVQATAPGWVLRPSDAGEREAALVLALFDQNAAAAGTISGDAATEAAFRAQAPAAAWLHIGVPFRMNGASPAFSPMLWAAGPPTENGAPAPEDDGVLQAREMMNLDLRARAVVFSDPAATSMRDGAAAVPTVSWAWRAAGVPVLMMPRWTIDARTQEEFLLEFYKRLKADERADAALEAARAFARSRDGTSAPWAWAAWMMIGR